MVETEVDGLDKISDAMKSVGIAGKKSSFAEEQSCKALPTKTVNVAEAEKKSSSGWKRFVNRSEDANPYNIMFGWEDSRVPRSDQWFDKGRRKNDDKGLKAMIQGAKECTRAGQADTTAKAKYVNFFKNELNIRGNVLKKDFEEGAQAAYNRLKGRKDDFVYEPVEEGKSLELGRRGVRLATRELGYQTVMNSAVYSAFEEKLDQIRAEQSDTESEKSEKSKSSVSKVSIAEVWDARGAKSTAATSGAGKTKVKYSDSDKAYRSPLDFAPSDAETSRAPKSTAGTSGFTRNPPSFWSEKPIPRDPFHRSNFSLSSFGPSYGYNDSATTSRPFGAGTSGVGAFGAGTSAAGAFGAGTSGTGTSGAGAFGFAGLEPGTGGFGPRTQPSTFGAIDGGFEPNYGGYRAQAGGYRTDLQRRMEFSRATQQNPPSTPEEFLNRYLPAFSFSRQNE